jgi:O-antigen ligase
LPRRTEASEERPPSASAFRRLLPPGGVQRFLALVLLTGAVLVPLLVSLQGLDVFRLPKQLAMYAVAILAGAGAAIGLLFSFDSFKQQWKRIRTPLLLTVAVLVWSSGAAVFSANRALSIDALGFALAVAIIGVSATFSLRDTGWPLVAAAILIPALVNVSILILQAYDIWNPWVFEPRTPERSFKNALIGDTNTVGAYLLAPMIFSAVLALSTSSRNARIFLLFSTCILGAGLILSETRTSLVGAVFAFSTLAALRLRLRAAPIIIIIVIAAAAVSLAYEPLRVRMTRTIESVDLRDLDVTAAGRLPAFVAAWEMFKGHPIAGVGPGVFKFEYLPYRVAASGDYPSIPGLGRPGGPNFGEVHNDHLQFLAEIGLPGYLMVLSLLGSVGAVSLRRGAVDDQRDQIARLLALPLCVGLFITMVAGFPLQRAASIYTFVLMGALCLAWSSRDDVA